MRVWVAWRVANTKPLTNTPKAPHSLSYRASRNCSLTADLAVIVDLSHAQISDFRLGLRGFSVGFRVQGLPFVIGFRDHGSGLPACWILR